MPEDPPLMGAYALALDLLFAAWEWTHRPQAARRTAGKPAPAAAGEVGTGAN